MSRPVHLLSIATALPRHVLWQREVASTARAIFGPRYDQFERLSGIFENSGIMKRHAVPCPTSPASKPM
jgi:alkylresorcinol/alkylpyrone synthase